MWATDHHPYLTYLLFRAKWYRVVQWWSLPSHGSIMDARRFKEHCPFEGDANALHHDNPVYIANLPCLYTALATQTVHYPVQCLCTPCHIKAHRLLQFYLFSLKRPCQRSSHLTFHASRFNFPYILPVSHGHNISHVLHVTTLRTGSSPGPSRS
jgi:hypothetical protein